MSAPYLWNTLSDFDETWYKYSSHQHNRRTKFITRSRSWLEVKGHGCQIFSAPYLGNASSDFEETWYKYSSNQHNRRTNVTAKSRSRLEVEGHGCQNSVLYIFSTPHRILTELGTKSSSQHDMQDQGHREGKVTGRGQRSRLGDISSSGKTPL